MSLIEKMKLDLMKLSNFELAEQERFNLFGWLELQDIKDDWNRRFPLDKEPVLSDLNFYW